MRLRIYVLTLGALDIEIDPEVYQFKNHLNKHLKRKKHNKQLKIQSFNKIYPKIIDNSKTQIERVKSLVKEKMHIDENIYLIKNGQILCDAKRLVDYSVDENDVLYVQKFYDEQKDVRVRANSADKVIQFLLKHFDTLSLEQMESGNLLFIFYRYTIFYQFFNF